MNIIAERSPFKSVIEDNTKYVTVKEDVNEQPLDIEDTARCIQYLKYSFQIERIEKEPIKLKVSEDTLKYLERYLNTTKINLPQDESYALITEFYRCLRNSATNELSQNYICFHTSILETTKIIIKSVQTDNLCIKIILQFLINLTTLNIAVVYKIHTDFFVFILNLAKEGKHIYECSAIIYNISLVIPLNINTIELMFNLSCIETNQTEFVLLFLENCITKCEFWKVFSELNISNRLIALETLRTQQISNKQYKLPTSGIETIISNFLKSPNIFFKIDNLTVYEEVHEVSILLEILSSLSSKDDYIKILQNTKDILVNAGALLINFHKLGKTGNNLFTPVQKLSETGPEEMNNPVFGIKADLVRLIGNMCWKNVQMQDLAREAEVIPVILDCCNIDAKNPFIIQWCIFAIRNICENNVENQKLISGLHQRGTVSTQVLDEFGITLDTDGENQLKIVPLDSLKK